MLTWICPQKSHFYFQYITFDCQQAYNLPTLNHSLWGYVGKNETSIFSMLYWFLLHRCSRNVSHGDEGFRNVCFQGSKFQTSRGDQVFWLSCCWLFVPKLPLDNVHNITSQVAQFQPNNVPPSACFIILIGLIDFVVWETIIYSILHKISIINNNSLKRSQPYCYCVLLQFCNVEASLTASQIKVYDTAVHVWYAF